MTLHCYLDPADGLVGAAAHPAVRLPEFLGEFGTPAIHFGQDLREAVKDAADCCLGKLGGRVRIRRRVEQRLCRSSASHSGFAGDPAKPRTRASSAISGLSPYRPGSTIWNRYRTNSSVVRLSTALVRTTPHRLAGRRRSSRLLSRAADSTKWATAPTIGSVRVSDASPRGTARSVLNGMRDAPR